MNYRVAVAVMAAIAASAAAPARAELGWLVGAGVARSDNATRVVSGKVDDTLAMVGAAIGYEHTSRRLDFSLAGSATYLEYLDNTFDSDLVASATGELVFGVVPERFLWTIDNTFGQLAINQFEPVTPDNRQNANYFATGPDFIMRLGSQTDLRVAGRYTNSRYEETDSVNDERLTAELALVRRTSANVAWSVVARTMTLEYDLPGDPGYDLHGVFGRLEAVGVRQTLSVDLGASRIESEGDSETNPVLRLGWERQLSPSWTMDMTAGTEYRNSTDRFVAGADDPAGGTGQVTLTGVPSESYYGGLGFRFERIRTGFYVGTAYSRNNFIGSGELDEEEWVARTGVSRRFTQRLQGLVDASYRKRDFGAGSEDTQAASVRLDWAVGGATYLTLGYRFEKRDSDLGDFEYTENLLFLGISYRQGTIDTPRLVAF